MNDWPLLSIVTFLPLAGAICIALVRGDANLVASNVRWVALWFSLITFVISLFLWFNFDTTTADFQFVERAVWIPGYNITYYLGVDGISMLFVLLSTLLTPVCILASWDSIQERVKEYMIAFLILETIAVGARLGQCC